jgi:transcriptional regulator with XRE-family HTH domain
VDATRLGSVFRAVRIRLRLRQLDVARRGVARSSVSRIERGLGGSLPVDTLMKVAAITPLRVRRRA